MLYIHKYVSPYLKLSKNPQDEFRIEIAIQYIFPKEIFIKKNIIFKTWVIIITKSSQPSDFLL